jgi:integrase
LSEEYGELHIADLDRKGFRSHVRVWHEGIGKKTARTADMTLAVFQRLVKFAVNEELIARNRISDMEKLHRVTHKEQVWPISLINHVLENAKPHIRDVFLFALVTMQRQGDCLSAPVLAYQDGRLAIKQGKGHARVWITPPELLKPIIDREHGQRTLLVNSRGEPWTQSGFQSSYKKEMKRLEIEGYRFHDLRGTGITFCYHMGIDLETIAHISGHTNSEINNTIRRHYLAGEMVANAFDGTFGKQKV